MLYTDHRPPRGSGTVTVRLRRADLVGTAGQWLGRLGPGASRMSFPMRQEDGEWRIATAPNALLVPRTFYEQNFTDASLFFFDPTGRILVPEVVHVPQGQQLTTSLVRALLLGPLPTLTGVARTFIPPGLTAGPVVVTAGRADVSLNGPDPGPMTRRTTRLLLAQLTWTLQQDPSVTTFDVSINGRQVTDSSGSSTFRVDGLDATRYDPAVPLGQQPALRAPPRSARVGAGRPPDPGRGTLRRRPAGHRAVRGESRRQPGRRHDLRRAAPRPGARFGASAAGARAAPACCARPGTSPAGCGRCRTPVEAVPRSSTSSAGTGTQVRVPGVTGHDVQRFLVSRDGSRLVAVVRGRSADRLVVSRLLYNPAGRSVAGTRARAAALVRRAGSRRIRDVGWTSPTTLAVLYQPSRLGLRGAAARRRRLHLPDRGRAARWSVAA